VYVDSPLNLINMARRSANEPENKAALRLGQFVAQRGLDDADASAYSVSAKGKLPGSAKPAKKAPPKKATKKK
jgi:hypothetical protein